MQNVIRTIIEKIPSGRIFDSHYIINQIIKNYSDEYLAYAGNFNAATDRTLVVHGNIGKEISKFNTIMIRQLSDPSWSENIHGNASECTCWLKI